MELAIIRRETIGSGNIFFMWLQRWIILKLGATSTTENETVGKFEVMDGCPSKGMIE